MSRMRKIGKLVVLVVILASAVGVLVFRQRIVDQVKYWEYEPAPAIAAMADRSGMSDEGRFYFYVTHPRLESAEQFNEDCRKNESVNPVLGCYISGADTIHIYDITNQDLDGIKEVTAAHEMLHAVWARMSQAERKELGPSLRSTYERVKTPELETRMAYYAESGEETVVSELYAILPTEVSDIGPQLESHYKKYFYDRQKVVALYVDYSVALNELDAELKTLSESLEKDRQSIEQQELRLKSDIEAMNQRVATFNSRAASGYFTSNEAFERERSVIIASQSTINARQREFIRLVDSYNQKVQRLNELGGKMNQLTRSIDSMQEVGQ